jgi:uncharacterized protein YutE (UPF0331/DUF86 family)
MIDDVATNKAAIIRRCLSRVSEEHHGDSSRLDDFTIQDSVVLNLLRACEASIDLAMHRISLDKLGIPQSSRDAFDILHANHVIRAATSIAMKNMVGFRNIAVHSYQKLQRPILEAIVSRHLSDFEEFLSDLSTPPSTQS